MTKENVILKVVQILGNNVFSPLSGMARHSMDVPLTPLITDYGVPQKLIAMEITLLGRIIGATALQTVQHNLVTHSTKHITTTIKITIKTNTNTHKVLILHFHVIFKISDLNFDYIFRSVLHSWRT